MCILEKEEKNKNKKKTTRITNQRANIVIMIKIINTAALISYTP